MFDSFDDHTLVITTFNRPQYLFRLLNYIARDLPVGSVRIIDGSLEPWRGENRDVVADFAEVMPLTLEQIEPGIDILDHHRHAYGCAETPFMTFCHDDNFCVPATIRESIRFLRANPGYVTCSGLIAGLRMSERRIVAYVSDGVPLDQDAPLERLAHFIANHWSADFGTWRSHARRSAVATFDLYHLDESIGEPISCGISALLGKFHLLPKISTIFCSHAANRGSESAQRKSNLVMPEFPGVLTAVARAVGDFCADWGVEPPSDGRAFYLTAYLRYMSKWWHLFRAMAGTIRGTAEAGVSSEELTAVDDRVEAGLVHDLLGLSETEAATVREWRRAVDKEVEPSKGELFTVAEGDLVLVDVAEPKADAATVMALPQATVLPAIYRKLHEMLLQPDWHEQYCAHYDVVAGAVLGRLATRPDARDVFDAAFLMALVNLLRPLQAGHPSRMDHVARLLDIDGDVSPARDALLLASALCRAYPSPRGDADGVRRGAAAASEEKLRFRIFRARPPADSVAMPVTIGKAVKNQGVAFIPLDLSGAPRRHFSAGLPLWLCVEVAEIRGKMQFGLYGQQSFDMLIPVTEQAGPRALYLPVRSLETEYLIMRDISRGMGPGQCRIARLRWLAGRRPCAETEVYAAPGLHRAAAVGSRLYPAPEDQLREGDHGGVALSSSPGRPARSSLVSP